MKEYILRLCVGLVILLPTISLAQEVEWVARYNGPVSGDDNVAYNSIVVDNSGNVYVTGSSTGQGTGLDYATIKYDSLGEEQWVARYNGPGNGKDMVQTIAVDNSGNVYVTGESWGAGTKRDYATIKYDSLGEEQWVARYNGLGNDDDWPFAIAVDNSGNVYVTGSSRSGPVYSDIVTVKYNSLGEEQWAEPYNGLASGHDFGAGNAVDNSGHVYVSGTSWGSGTGYDYVIIKYSQPPGIAEERATSVENSYLGATIFSGPLQLPKGKNYKVFDITGRIVEPANITRGIYFIETDDVVNQKVIKIR